jgi:hypothetical protein
MYRSGKNPLHRIAADSESVYIPRGLRQRRLHKAFLRYHDPKNWPLLRDALRRMGRADLIGNGQRQLIPAWQPAEPAGAASAALHATKQPFRTQHTGLPDHAGQGKKPSGRHRTGATRTRSR